jgi:hypothetical protein
MLTPRKEIWLLALFGVSGTLRARDQRRSFALMRLT